MSKVLSFLFLLLFTTSVDASPQDILRKVAIRNNVPVALVLAVAKVESNFTCNISHSGNIGILQVQPKTARAMGISGNLRDCETGAEAGVRYLKLAIGRGINCSTISQYNKGIGRPGCTSYGRKVMKIYFR